MFQWSSEVPERFHKDSNVFWNCYKTLWQGAASLAPHQFLTLLSLTCASRNNAVQFFISHPPRWLRTRHFSPSGTKIPNRKFFEGVVASTFLLTRLQAHPQSPKHRAKVKFFPTHHLQTERSIARCNLITAFSTLSMDAFPADEKIPKNSRLCVWAAPQLPAGDLKCG